MTTYLIMAAGVAALAAPSVDRNKVARLDRVYQEAVKRNDVATMDRILHPSFQLVLGDGRKISRKQLIMEAKGRRIAYELQDEVAGTQSVRVWGDTAIVTAKLRLKGAKDGRSFNRTLWFSDTYVRTDRGWKYLFGQASLPLPQESDDKTSELGLSETLEAAGFQQVREAP